MPPLGFPPLGGAAALDGVKGGGQEGEGRGRRPNMGPKAHIPLGFAPFPPLGHLGPLWEAHQPTKGLVPHHS